MWPIPSNQFFRKDPVKSELNWKIILLGTLLEESYYCHSEEKIEVVLNDSETSCTFETLFRGKKKTMHSEHGAYSDINILSAPNSGSIKTE